MLIGGGMAAAWGVQTEVRTYRGSRAKASDAFRLDAVQLSGWGYRVAGQSWMEGGRTDAAKIFVAGGVVCMLLALMQIGWLLIGILCLVIGLASGKGPGTLVVTYERQLAAPSAGTVPAAAPDPMAAMDSLKAMRDAGHLSDGEYAAKKAEILARM